LINNHNSIKHFEELFLKNSKDALYYMHLPSGKCEYITDSSTSLFGYTPEEFYNNPLLVQKLIHPDCKEYFTKMYQELMTGNATKIFEYKIIDKDNNIKWLNQRTSIVKDGEKNIVAIKAIISDITHHKTLQEDLEESKDKLTTLLEASSDWIWEIDTNGIFTFVSDRVKDFLGYEVDEIVGKNSFSTMPQDEAKRVEKFYNKLLEERKPFKDFENINIHKDSSLVTLQTTGFPLYDKENNFIGYRGVDRDVTNIKSLIKNLNEAQAIAKVGHWKLDYATNELFWSEEVFRIFGLAPSEIEPSYKDFFNYVYEEDYRLVSDAYTKSLEDKKPYSITHRIITKDKKLKYIEQRCIHTLDIDGNIIRSIGTIHDITKRIEYEKELEIASIVFKHSSDGILISDKNNKIISVNKSFEKLTGYSKEEILGKDPKLLSSGWGDNEFYKDMWSSLLEHDFWSNNLRDRNKDGSVYEVEQSIICVRDKNQQIVNFIAISHDITEAKDSESKIHQLAFYDFLTKLPNEKLFKQEVETYLKSSHYNSEEFAILFLDLDNFKWVNDSLGHQVGDLVLIEMAQKLKSIISEDSILSRLGGDEFIILAPYENLLSISQLANAILETVKDPIKIQDREVNVGWSVGISLYPQNGKKYNDLLKNADAAMYEAKNKGKNTFRYFNDAMNQDAIYRLELDTKLRHAIANNSFFLNYQPKYSYTEHKTIGVEALIRWIDKDFGFIPPDKFIPIAEESNYINKIGSLVIKQALHDLKIINQKLSFPITISINVSANQLDDENFYNEVKELLHKSGVEPSLIEFEITETSIMQNIQSVIEILNKIKKLGIKLSIDDFGTGYSSMSYLKKLPIDTLKIDREFVRELEKDDDSKSIVNAIMALAKSLNLKTVAEGVENEEQSEILRTIECDMLQGYLYSKPLSLDDLVEFLS